MKTQEVLAITYLAHCIWYSLGFLLKLSTTQKRIKFYLSLLFLQKNTWWGFEYCTVSARDFIEIRQVLFLSRSSFMLTKFLQEDILEPFMCNELHPWILKIVTSNITLKEFMFFFFFKYNIYVVHLESRIASM